jgi:adenosine deaminase
LIHQVETLESLPKIDIHRHLEGSLRLSSLAEIAGSEKLPLPTDPEQLRPHVQIAGDASVEAAEFMAKFKNIRMFFRSRETIQRIVREAIQDAADDSIRVLELRFTPAALAQEGGHTLEQVTDWVNSAIRSASQDYGIEVVCLLSVNRHEPVAIAESVVDIAIDRSADGIVVGVDLAGDEAGFPADPFRAALLRAKDAGLGITIHAGEWAGAENVRRAIDSLGADRIGHGIRILDDQDVTMLAAKKGIAFEVSLTSNWKTGAISELRSHPIREMIQAGLAVALTTDDPSIFETTLSNEFGVARKQFDFSIDSIKAFNLTALQASFLPERTKRGLERELVQAYWGSGEDIAANR